VRLAPHSAIRSAQAVKIDPQVEGSLGRDSTHDRGRVLVTETRGEVARHQRHGGIEIDDAPEEAVALSLRTPHAVESGTDIGHHGSCPSGRVVVTSFPIARRLPVRSTSPISRPQSGFLVLNLRHMAASLPIAAKVVQKHLGHLPFAITYDRYEAAFAIRRP